MRTDVPEIRRCVHPIRLVYHTQIDRFYRVRIDSVMFITHRFGVFLSLAVALLLGSVVARAERGAIVDGGGFFSDAAKAEANRQLLELDARFKKEVVIETFKAIPAEVSQGVNLQDRAAVKRMFEAWTLRQARQQRVNGIYILLSKEPAHLQVVIGNETQRTLFTTKDRAVLLEVMLGKLRAKQPDDALLQGVSVIDSAMKSHGLDRAPSPAQNPAAVEKAESGPWDWVLAAGLGFLVAWLVVGLMRSLFNRGGAGTSPGAGGGFMTSLLGGLFGAAAGMWLYNQFSGPSGSEGESGANDDAGSTRRDTDYSSSGDSFSDDSGGGDSGGGDSGGGDF